MAFEPADTVREWMKAVEHAKREEESMWKLTHATGNLGPGQRGLARRLVGSFLGKDASAFHGFGGTPRFARQVPRHLSFSEPRGEESEPKRRSMSKDSMKDIRENMINNPQACMIPFSASKPYRQACMTKFWRCMDSFKQRYLHDVEGIFKLGVTKSGFLKEKSYRGEVYMRDLRLYRLGLFSKEGEPRIGFGDIGEDVDDEHFDRDSTYDKITLIVPCKKLVVQEGEHRGMPTPLGVYVFTKFFNRDYLVKLGERQLVEEYNRNPRQVLKRITDIALDRTDEYDSTLDISLKSPDVSEEDMFFRKSESQKFAPMIFVAILGQPNLTFFMRTECTAYEDTVGEDGEPLYCLLQELTLEIDMNKNKCDLKVSHTEESSG